MAGRECTIKPTPCPWDDEVGYIPFEAEAANLFFQLVSARYALRTARQTGIEESFNLARWPVGLVCRL
jgi:hypothetical protein